MCLSFHRVLHYHSELSPFNTHTQQSICVCKHDFDLRPREDSLHNTVFMEFRELVSSGLGKVLISGRYGITFSKILFNIFDINI